MVARMCVALLALALVGWAEGYPDMAGSCEGVFSGAHVRLRDIGKAKTDGGWKFKIVLEPTDAMSKVKTGAVSLVNDAPNAYYTGFLLKSFDLQTGEYIGSFSNLPMGTELFAGCPVAQAAVHHNQEVYFTGSGPDVLTVNVEWPADRELGFAFFPVEDEYEWFQVYGSTSGLRPANGLDNLALYQDFWSARLGKEAWTYLYFAFYLPIILLVFVGALAKGTNGPGGIGAKLNQTVPIKAGPADLQMSLGEWLSQVLFYVVQGIVLALMTVQVISETKGLPYSEDDGVKWYPNPWDAAFARALGRLLQGNMALTLLLPTRNSVWPAFVGISFERCVKYHRIIGRWTFINMIAHLIGMVLVYGNDCLTLRSGRWGEGNLYGTLAGVSMILLVLSAAEPVRRRSYELFLALHMMAFPMLIFSVLHVRDTLIHLVLPLLLYTADWVLRILQWSKNVKILNVASLPEGCTRLHLHCPSVARGIWEKQAQGLAAFVYLQCPSISKNPLEWHPFTVSSLLSSGDTEMRTMNSANSGDTQEVPDGITVHIKSMGVGTWSDNLNVHVSNKLPISVRMEGPYGHMGVELSKYSHVLSVNGGVGFTPCAPLLQMVLNPQRRKACLPLLKSLHVVWVVRTHAQLSWFSQLLEKARALAPTPDFALHVDLYVTQAPAIVPSGPGANLRSRTGRPQLSEIMKQVTQACNGEAVAALVCGPAPLTSETVKLAREAGFHTHTETFLL